MDNKISSNPFLANQGAKPAGAAARVGAAFGSVAKGGAAGPENRILPGIQCFAWKADMSKIALCPCNSEIWIFETQKSEDISKWTKTHVLSEHFNEVTALEWNPKHQNLLLSASADRGVVVWEEVDGEYRPQMGIIPEKRANTDASWNHRGDKFVVGASSGCIYFGTYNSQQNLWVAHPISKRNPHKATVLCCRYDPPAGKVVASAGLDGNCVITSNVCKLDENETAGPFGSVTEHGQKLMEFHCNGWINYVAFSPAAATVCFVSHDCELNFADTSKGKDSTEKSKVFHGGNPHMNCVFVNEDTLVACGYDKAPFVYKRTNGEWKEEKCCDPGIKAARVGKVGHAIADKKVYFNPDILLPKEVEIQETGTKHQNYINAMQLTKPNQVCTTDVNGVLAVWNL